MINLILRVISSDMWLDRPHGASIIKMLEFLSNQAKTEIELVVWSKEDLVERRGNLSIKTIKVPEKVKESSFSYFLRTFKESLSYMMGGDLIIFDYPLIPAFVVSKSVRSDIKGISLVLSRPIHNDPLHPKNIAYRLSLLLGRGKVDLFTGITPYEALDIGRYVGNKVIVLPSPLAPEFLEPPEDCDRVLRVHMDGEFLDLMESGTNLILYHGALDVRRGLLRILESFGRAFHEGGPILTVLGRGDAVPIVLRYQSIYPSIRYFGSVPLDVIPCVMRSISSGIAWFPDEPRWRYQLPTKILEFMASQKPFLTSPLPGISWAIGKCSLAVYSRDISPSVLQAFWSEAARLRDDGGSCKERAKKFSAERVAAILLSHIYNLTS